MVLQLEVWLHCELYPLYDYNRKFYLRTAGDSFLVISQHSLSSAFHFTGMFLDFFDGMVRKLNAVSDMERTGFVCRSRYVWRGSFYACLQCRIVRPSIYRDLMRIDVQHLRNASPL